MCWRKDQRPAATRGSFNTVEVITSAVVTSGDARGLNRTIYMLETSVLRTSAVIKLSGSIIRSVRLSRRTRRFQHARRNQKRRTASWAGPPFTRCNKGKRSSVCQLSLCGPLIDVQMFQDYLRPSVSDTLQSVRRKCRPERLSSK